MSIQEQANKPKQILELWLTVTNVFFFSFFDFQQSSTKVTTDYDLSISRMKQPQLESTRTRRDTVGDILNQQSDLLS